ASTTKSRRSRRTIACSSGSSGPALGPTLFGPFLAVFFIGGSLSQQPREFPRGDLDRHFNFNRSRDYTASCRDAAPAETSRTCRVALLGVVGPMTCKMGGPFPLRANPSRWTKTDGEP